MAMRERLPIPGTWLCPFAGIASAALYVYVLLGVTNSEVVAQEFRLERVWEVGSIDGSPETIWSRIEDATVMGGRVYAVDIELVTVRAYQLSGEYQGELGRSGQGPGEFARPISLSARSDTLSVFDLALRRWALFDAEGEHIQTSRVPFPPEPQGIRRVWKARHGWYIGTTLIIGRSTPDRSVTDLYTVAWRSPERSDTLLTISSNPISVRYEPDSPRLSLLTSINLGPDGGSWLLSDSLLATLDAAEGRLRVWRITATEVEERGAHEVDGERNSLTSRDREVAAAWVNARFGLSPDDSIAEFVFPESWSPWTAVLGDDEGNVWIRRGGVQNVDPSAGEQWLRLSLQDGSMTAIELPPGVEALRFREGHLVGKRKGEYGVERLVLYRLVGG